MIIFGNVGQRWSGMLYSCPEHEEEARHSTRVFEAKASSSRGESSGPGIPAPGQPDRTIQEVWQARLPLRQGGGARSRHLPFRDSRSREDAVLLCPRATEEADCTIRRELPQAPRACGGGHQNQPRPSGNRRLRRRVDQVAPAMWWIRRGGLRLPKRMNTDGRSLIFEMSWSRCFSTSSNSPAARRTSRVPASCWACRLLGGAHGMGWAQSSRAARSGSGAGEACS